MKEIVRVEKKYEQEILTMACDQYLKQCSVTEELENPDYRTIIGNKLHKPICSGAGFVLLEEQEVQGYLLVDGSWENDECRYFYLPVWGYGAKTHDKSEQEAATYAGTMTEEEKILGKLFQRMAKEFCTDKKVNFLVNLYSYDQKAIRLFSLMQFGIQCEEGILSVREAVEPCCDGIVFCELEKEEIQQRWTEVWNLVSSLVDHLKESPVFYPGTEFTEEVYKEYLLDADTRLYTASEGDKIVGIIDSARSSNTFFPDAERMNSAGDIYVLPDYRGKGISKALLNYLEVTLREEGVQKLWVEHGTANPNARGFWNRYFATYQYQMVREIIPV